MTEFLAVQVLDTKSGVKRDHHYSMFVLAKSQRWVLSVLGGCVVAWAFVEKKIKHANAKGLLAGREKERGFIHAPVPAPRWYYFCEDIAQFF